MVFYDPQDAPESSRIRGRAATQFIPKKPPELELKEDGSGDFTDYNNFEKLDQQVAPPPEPIDAAQSADDLDVGDWHYADIVEAGFNIADLLSEEQLEDLSERVLREFELDEASRADVMTAYDDAMRAARNERVAKNYPFQNAANVRYPLINTAALQFAARAYPAIISGADIVKVGVNGDDPDGMKAERAKRVSEHMSYQCLREMPEWEKQIDELLLHLPLAGTAFRCIEFDPELGRSKTELVTLKDFVVSNEATTIQDTPRYTRIRHFYPYQIQEKMKSGFYRDRAEQVLMETDEDSQKMRMVLEQHRRHDLDGDGCAEPYVVTVDKETGEVLRVVASGDLDTLIINADEEGAPYVARATHEQIYVRYVFIPDPEGKFHGMGFGQLLAPISEAINTAFNQILDAGHLQNGGGGFLAGNVDFGKRKEVRLRPGEWRQLKAYGSDIRQAIVPFNWPGPSPVLFQLLGLLIEAGKEIGSIKDVLSGDASSANMPVGTTMALIEQGLQAFTAIYKRVYRALTEEFELLYSQNARYLDDEVYFMFGDSEKHVARIDYALGTMDVTPVADPTIVTTMQRMSKAEFGLQFKGQPHIDSAAVDKRAMEAAGIDNPEELFVKPDPAMQEAEMRAMQRVERREEAEIAEIESKVVKNVSDAESKETETDIKEAEAVLGAVRQGQEMAISADQDDSEAETRQVA